MSQFRFLATKFYHFSFIEKAKTRIWGFEKKQLVELLPPNERVEIQSWARPDKFVRYGRRALVGLRADDVKAVSIERLCVSLLMSKNI